MGLRDRSFISKAPNPPSKPFYRWRQLPLPLNGFPDDHAWLLVESGHLSPLAEESALQMASKRAGWLGALVGGALDAHWLPEGWKLLEIGFLRWKTGGWALVVKAQDQEGYIWRAWQNEPSRSKLVPALIWLVRNRKLPWRRMSPR